MPQAVHDRQDSEPLDQGVDALIDQMAGAAPALEKIGPKEGNATLPTDVIASAPSTEAALASAAEQLAATPEASDLEAAQVEPTTADSATAEPVPPTSVAEARASSAPISEQSIAEQSLAVPPSVESAEADPMAEPTASEPRSSERPGAAVATPMEATAAAAPVDDSGAATGLASEAAQITESGASSTEADLAGAVSQLIDSTKAAPESPSKASVPATPERIDSLDAALAGKGDELIAGEFADENSVLSQAEAPEPDEPAPGVAEERIESPVEAKPERAPSAAVKPSGAPSEAIQTAVPWADTAPPEPIAAKPSKPAFSAIAVGLLRPIGQRAGSLVKAALYSMSAPLHGKPKHVRDAIAWVALVQGFFAVCVWGYIAFRPKEARPPDGPIAKADGHGTDGHGAGAGHGKDDGHGAAKKDAHGKPSAKKDSHGAAKKDDHGAAKKDAHGKPSAKKDSHGAAKKKDSHGAAKKDSHGAAKKEPASKSKKAAKDSHGGH
ncbi:MAG: hypothetical protein ACKVW3_11495 [Phycisphaerales bacterium]